MIYRRPSLFWPIILIGVGVIFLLYNMGLITGNPWPMIFNLWPVLLIVIGLDVLLGRRSAAGSIVSAVLALLVVAGAIWLLAARPNLPFLLGGELKTERIQYTLGDIQSASVSLDYTGGENQLRALGDSNNLIEGDLSYYGALDFNATDSGERAHVRINTSYLCVFCSSGGGEKWDIRLNTRPLYDLDIDIGSGDTLLDLSRLNLTDSRIDMGSGSVEVRLPATGKFRVDVDGGSGSLRIRVPRAMAVRVEIDQDSGTFDAGRLQSVGRDTYETEDFDIAENAVSLIIEMGSGSVTIEDSE